MWILGLITASSVASLCLGLQGHLKPLGNHVAHDMVETEKEFPLPDDFFKAYSHEGKPVLFKGVFSKVKMMNWTDNYLKRHFGEVFVSTFYDKLMVNHGGKPKTRTLLAFLNEYYTENIYMVQNISEEMIPDMVMPRSMQCGGLQYYIDEILLQMSSGRTRTTFHVENVDNFHCVLDGIENLVLVDRKFKGVVEADGWNKYAGFSIIDVDKVDMIKYPTVRHLSTFKVTVKPGDCIFIPFRWYRQINSVGFRNVRLNYMIPHVPWFNHTNCSYVDLTEEITPFLMFSDTSKQHTIRFLSRLSGELSDIGVQKSVFLERYVKEDIRLVEKKAIIAFIDLNKDNTLQWEELLSLNVTDFMNNFYYQLIVTDAILEKCINCEEPGHHHHTSDDHHLSDDHHSGDNYYPLDDHQPGDETHDEF